VWLAMRQHPELIAINRGPDIAPEVYGISIRVGSSNPRLPAPAGILEAVVDGCLASFHRDLDIAHATQVADKLAAQLDGTGEQELLEGLTGSGPVLFTGPPFRRHPTFVQLSPCDERCMVGSLEVAHDGDHPRLALSGEIFALNQST